MPGTADQRFRPTRLVISARPARNDGSRSDHRCAAVSIAITSAWLAPLAAKRRVAVSKAVGIDIETQLNPAGGAIALGHPFGMTGIRLLCSLMDNLDDRGGRLGLATLCVGGGQGMAVLIERL